MKEIFNKIKYLFLSLRERVLLNNLKNTTKTSYTNKNTKNILAKGVSLTINSKTIQTVAQVKENVTALVKTTDCDPNALLNYIKTANTPIIKLNNADKLLNFINEEEGLIYEKRGFEALYLSLISGKGIKFKTEPMFILRDGVIDKYYMLHNFYRWYSLKSDLPGFDYPTQKKFKQYLNNTTDEFTKTLSMSEILSLQEAIARDQEATSYVLEFTKQVEGTKNVLDKIQNDGGANI